MTLHRRDFLAGGGTAALCLALAPELAFAATGKAERKFDTYVGPAKVGGQTLTLTRKGDMLTLDLRTDVSARLLNYRYAIRSREVWKDGVLMGISSKTNDNGKSDYVTAKRTGSGLEIDASRYSGVVKGNPASSSFFVPALATRKVWVSTQSGKPIKVSAQNAGMETLRTGAGVINCQKFRCAGELKIPVDVYYTSNGELAGFVAKAKGLRARSLAKSLDRSLTALW